MARQRPASVRNAVRVLVALVAASALASLLTWFEHDDLVLAWAQGNPAAQDILAQGGFEELRGNPIVPSFVPLAVVAFVVLAMLAWVLLAFFVEGHSWARLCLVATVAFLLFSVVVAMVALGADMPVSLLVLGIVSLLLDVLAIYWLVHKDTNAFIREF